MRKRTRAREFALQIMYEYDMTHAEFSEIWDRFWTVSKDTMLSHAEKKDVRKDRENDEIKNYTEKLVRGCVERLESIDNIIERFAEHWEIKRMAYVDRNIMRLAVYEILYLEEIPVKVAINEAVELAKRYGESDSSKFVNGILDKIAKTECKK